MESIYESVLSNLKHKKASAETLQLWEKIWSHIQEQGIGQLDDLLNQLIDDTTVDRKAIEGK